MKKAALYTAGLIFAVGAVGHLIRLTKEIEIAVNGTPIPVWVSLPGAAVATLLAVWMVMSARRP